MTVGRIPGDNGGENLARDTRRKILVGSLFLHRMDNDPDNGPRFRAWLKKELPGFLRETDRGLFDDILGETAEPKE